MRLIAPTVFAEEVGAVWKDNLRLAAEALAMEDEADAAIEAYQQSAAALGQSLGDPSATTVSALRFVEGTIRAYSPQSFIGTVLTDIGLSQLDLPPGEYAAFTEISTEQLELADADIMVYASFGPAQESGELEVLTGPLWPRLTAVQEGRAFAVDGDVYYSGIGLTAASLIWRTLPTSSRADQTGVSAPDEDRSRGQVDGVPSGSGHANWSRRWGVVMTGSRRFARGPTSPRPRSTSSSSTTRWRSRSSSAWANSWRPPSVMV